MSWDCPENKSTGQRNANGVEAKDNPMEAEDFKLQEMKEEARA